jgi:predicted nucleotidyltransferase
MHNGKQFYDLDHVLLSNGEIYRVLGNFRNKEIFLGYNVYSPNAKGNRIYRCKKYVKNFIEDEQLPQDVLETYEVLNLRDVVLHLDPVQSARENSSSFQNTFWFELYETLKDLFGEDAVGIFGSSMFNLHLTADGQVRKDVDFVIDGLENVDKLRHNLPEIRQRLGFHEISEARQLRQYERYQKVFQNNHNTIQEIIKRRWTGLQLSENIVSTIRFREKSITLPIELVHDTTVVQRNVVVSGRVIDADKSNLFPRMFTLETEKDQYPVYLWWWKFSTPAHEYDHMTICGDKIMLEGREVIRVTNFHDHWLAFDNETVSTIRDANA